MNDTLSLTCWTDGACSGNPGPGGWAALIGSELISGGMKYTTNNEMELFAVYQAVMNCPARAHLVIYTDSKLVIGWCAQNWRVNSPMCRDLIVEIFHMAKARGVTFTFRKTKGHATDLNNDRVDRAARMQARFERDCRRAALEHALLNAPAASQTSSHSSAG